MTLSGGGFPPLPFTFGDVKMRFYAFGDSVYMFSREEFAKAWLKDKRAIQKIGVSRQTAFQWCRGETYPNESRAGLICELVPEVMKFVGKVPT